MELLLAILYWLMWVYVGGAVLTGLFMLFKGQGSSASERLRTIFLWPVYVIFLILILLFYKGN